MPSRRPLVVRIVVNGSPSTTNEVSNSSRARDMPMRAFEPKNWPIPAKPVPFAVTPGGFIKARFPQCYDGSRGWDSGPEDFKQLVPWMEKALWDVVTEEPGLFTIRLSEAHNFDSFTSA